MPAPVIIVGNLSVGGTGKTPVVIWLARLLCAAGLKPGILSRGYGGRSRTWPLLVDAQSDPREVGDEPKLIAEQTGCPLAVAPDRVAAGRFLLSRHACDVLICDDGLQHYRLQRDLEILVIDGERRYGNGLCLPAGPLREPLGRGRSVDFTLANGTAGPGEYALHLEPRGFRQVAHLRQCRDLESLRGASVHAVAGIGAPERFFRMLENLGMQVIPHPYADHHGYIAADLHFDDRLAVVMTGKDAVKCRAFAPENCWSLEVDLQPEAPLPELVLVAVRRLVLRHFAKNQ